MDGMDGLITHDYTRRLLACAYAVHTAMGPGLLENIYEKALVYELKQSGFIVESQVPVKVFYRGIDLECDLRLDLLVDHRIIIELKSVRELLPVHYKQLLSYMRLSDVKMGFLINFNVTSLKDGIHRIVDQ